MIFKRFEFNGVNYIVLNQVSFDGKDECAGCYFKDTPDCHPIQYAILDRFSLRCFRDKLIVIFDRPSKKERAIP